VQPAPDTGEVAERVRAELLAKIAASLGMAGSDMTSGAVPPAPTLAAAAGDAATAGDYEPAWIDSPECTACDECTNLAPKAFAYNDQKQAIVIDARGAKFADIVKAAEKCTAGCIHPGTPWNMKEPGVEKLMARAAKYN